MAYLPQAVAANASPVATTTEAPTNHKSSEERLFIIENLTNKFIFHLHSRR
jgi:hypothetical protein